REDEPAGRLDCRVPVPRRAPDLRHASLHAAWQARRQLAEAVECGPSRQCLHERDGHPVMSTSFHIWRSMLFVPAHVPKFVDAAHTRGADAYLLDLEDSVPQAQKAEARAALVSAVAKVSQSGAAALVRINTDDALTQDDVNAAV